MAEDVTKHLEFIQSVIGRMAANSFLLKGWSVTLVAALFALAVKESNLLFAAVALLPAISFWGMDAWYLRQERLFRRLYDEVRCNQEAAAADPFSLSTARFADGVDSWFRTLWAVPVLGLHLPVVAVIVLALLLSGVASSGC